jgi:2-C-methyl-D-erythritol 4-phosphate cytidylyltransferase
MDPSKNQKREPNYFMSHFTAILLMGGQGLRIGESTPKQFLPLGDKLLYEYALSTFCAFPYFEEILLVSSSTSISPLPSHVRVVQGGKTRQESSFIGLCSCKKETEYVVIHDIARPFITHDILKRNIESVVQYKAVNTCIPSSDTINTSHSTRIEKIFDRKISYLGQTPQSFSYPLILDAHHKTKKSDASDDCSLVLDLGHPVHFVLGSSLNFKITNPFDLELASFILTNSGAGKK